MPDDGKQRTEIQREKVADSSLSMLSASSHTTGLRRAGRTGFVGMTRIKIYGRTKVLRIFIVKVGA